MRIVFKIHRLIFDEQGIIFAINRIGTREYFHCSVSQLFVNEKLLTEFSHADIRLISYFAAVEDYQADCHFFQRQG